jgi:hypothetical protein
MLQELFLRPFEWESLMNRSLKLVTFFAAVCAAAPVQAYLGGFEPADGYTIIGVPQSGSNPVSQYIDVTYYNAGQNGPNAGGGAMTALAPDAGLWDLLTEPGAFFRNSATRTFYTSGAPPYNAFPSFSGDDVPAYIIGNHSPGYLSPSALALRNETPFSGPPIGGPMEYDYELDSFDFGGITPSSVVNGVVTMSFRFCPNPSDPPNPSGALPRDKFIMSFTDSVGDIGLQVGYAGDNHVYWRPGSSGSWNYSGIFADATNWDQFSVSIDLTNDTFEINYHQIVPNINTTLAPAGTPLGAGMADLTHLRWWLSDQVLGGVGGKNFFDAFGFDVPQIPEPSTAVLVLVAAYGMALKRRR